MECLYVQIFYTQHGFKRKEILFRITDSSQEQLFRSLPSLAQITNCVNVVTNKGEALYILRRSLGNTCSVYKNPYTKYLELFIMKRCTNRTFVLNILFFNTNNS